MSPDRAVAEFFRVTEATTIQLTIGHSEQVTTADAVAEILASCSGVEDPVAALLWTSQEYDVQDLVQAVSERWPGLPLAGCTTDGVFSSEAGFSHDGVLLTLISGEGLRAEVACASDLATRGTEAVREACESLSPNPALSFLFPAAAGHDVDAAVREAESILQCPMIGGCSADHREFEHCREIAGSQVFGGSMPILNLYGDLEVSIESGSGWFPIGREYRATRIEGSRVMEVDGAPALEMYRDYFGALMENALVEFPLSVQSEGGMETYFRGVFGIDSESGALILGGGIPEGSTLRMSEVRTGCMLEASHEALDRNLNRNAKPVAAFLFNCAGRKWVLGSAVTEETERMMHKLPGIPTVGIYGFGEIGRTTQSTQGAAYHNETCVTVLVYPKTGPRAA